MKKCDKCPKHEQLEKIIGKWAPENCNNRLTCALVSIAESLEEWLPKIEDKLDSIWCML